MPKKTNHIVKESNAIARAEIIPAPESVWEERLIAKVAAFNRVDSSEFPENIFTIGELLDKKPSGTQLRQVEKTVLNLAGSRFRVRERAGKFTVYPIFARVEYEDGIISAKFNPELKPYYLQLKQQFAIRSLPEFNRLSSTYSQRLYRYLNSWRNLADVMISLEELHNAMNATPSTRKNFKEFRKQVLEIAHREITEKTSLYFDWEPVRKGLRKIDAIRFIFTKEIPVVQPLALANGCDDAKRKAADECYLRQYNVLKKRCNPSKRGCKAKTCGYCTTTGLLGAMLALNGDNRTKQIWNGD